MHAAGIAFKETIPGHHTDGTVSISEHRAEPDPDVGSWDSTCDADAARGSARVADWSSLGPVDTLLGYLAGLHAEYVVQVAARVREHRPQVVVDVEGAVPPEAVAADV